ncbi:uroporphyrinogen III synthase [Thalassospira profundimaris]|uniref:Uroporphyrinogen-III synthase n=1 Tax=Thalassospira profundimaris TaxID=502049 RepID=A0A367XKE6_9PROT|nr:uroporphyrinogen-III synthase [Thalassospira profundimaris]RCK54133.1 uroporphyrinogen III synthase [Thalassospira profundimaris]
MGKTILNTRPETDSGDLDTLLKQRGYDVCHAPMLSIAFPPLPADQPTINLDGVQALIFTSANGVRAFTRHSSQRDLPVLAVGDATATTARAAGFETVYSANGDIHDLAGLITRQISPDDGVLYHPAARKVAGDLGTMLAAKGYVINRQTLYEAHAATSLPQPVREGLLGGTIHAVLFFSPRTAETFVKLMESHHTKGALTNVTALCLSPAVKDRLACLKWRKIVVAAQPTQESLLLELDTVII